MIRPLHPRGGYQGTWQAASIHPQRPHFFAQRRQAVPFQLPACLASPVGHLLSGCYQTTSSSSSVAAAAASSSLTKSQRIELPVSRTTTGAKGRAENDERFRSRGSNRRKRGSCLVAARKQMANRSNRMDRCRLSSALISAPRVQRTNPPIVVLPMAAPPMVVEPWGKTRSRISNRNPAGRLMASKPKSLMSAVENSPEFRCVSVLPVDFLVFLPPEVFRGIELRL